MLREAKVGERVQVLDRHSHASGKWLWVPQTYGTRASYGGGLESCWDFSKGNTGVVTRVWRHGRHVYIYVTPDPGFGIGHIAFSPSELRRIKEVGE